MIRGQRLLLDRRLGSVLSPSPCWDLLSCGSSLARSHPGEKTQCVSPGAQQDRSPTPARLSPGAGVTLEAGGSSPCWPTKQKPWGMMLTSPIGEQRLPVTARLMSRCSSNRPFHAQGWCLFWQLGWPDPGVGIPVLGQDSGAPTYTPASACIHCTFKGMK